MLPMQYKSNNCKEVGREEGDSSVAFFTTHKRERTQGWRLKPIFTLAHNNNTMSQGIHYMCNPRIHGSYVNPIQIYVVI